MFSGEPVASGLTPGDRGFAGAPEEGLVYPFDAKDKDLVLNAMLRIGAGALMVMDAPPSRPVPVDTNVHVFIDFDSTDELEKSFEALAQGGTVTMPVQDTFWGSRFGMLQDAFGIRWMLSHEQRKA